MFKFVKKWAAQKLEKEIIKLKYATEIQKRCVNAMERICDKDTLSEYDINVLFEARRQFEYQKELFDASKKNCEFYRRFLS